MIHPLSVELLQETVHQANNLAQSDEDEEDAHETGAAPAAAAGGVQKHKGPRVRNRGKGGLKVEGHATSLPNSNSHTAQHSAAAAAQDSLDSTPADDAAAAPGTSKRSKAPRRRGSKPSATPEATAAAAAEEDGSAAVPPALANGLHVDDALNAAKHAVQELWVPTRKPMPGGRGRP